MQSSTCRRRSVGGGGGVVYPRREVVTRAMRKTSWRQGYFAAPSKFNLHAHVTKKSLRRVQQLDRAGWIGPFADDGDGARYV